jgi:hypothetical protein
LNLDGRTNGARDGAVIGVNGMNPLDRLAHFLRRTEPVMDPDSAYDENVSIQLDFSQGLRNKLAL